MMRFFIVAALLALQVAVAQTTVTFWHSMGSVEETVQELADRYNLSQSDYRVEPRYVGDYLESQTKILAARGAEAPALYQAEIGFFPRLIEEGALADLTALTASLDEGFVDDFYPGLWDYGEIAGRRLGLPWNMSTPVLFYNASAFKQRGLEAPTTWEAFERAAAELTTRQTKGYIAISDDWTFETMVRTRGGSLVTEDGRPNFDSPESIAALTMLQRMVREGHAIPRSMAESTFAQLDFVRTKGMMVFASIANWPDAKRFAVAFNIAAAPVPSQSEAPLPLGGAQLVVLKSASASERKGAVDFWTFLMRTESLKTWIEASYYLPVRRSAAAAVEPWYAEDPNRRAALSQLERAVPRPRVADYSVWEGYLEEAIEKVLKAGADPALALAEAQRRASTTR